MTSRPSQQTPASPVPPTDHPGTGQPQIAEPAISEAMGWTLLTLAPLFWAGNIIVARAVHADLAPAGLSFWRWSLAVVIVAAVVWPQLRGQWGAMRRHAGYIMLMGALGVGVFPVLLYIGIKNSTALNASMLQALCPLLIPIIAWLMGAATITLANGLGVLVSMAGVAVLIGQGAPQNLLSGLGHPGDIWTIAAMLIWSLYSVLVRRRPAELSQTAFLVSTMAAGALITLPMWLIEQAYIQPMPTDWASLAALAYIVLGPSIAAYYCFNRGMERIGPARGGLAMHFVPLFGAVLAILVLGEPLRWYHGAGAALIFAGLIIANRGSGAPSPASPRPKA